MVFTNKDKKRLIPSPRNQSMINKAHLGGIIAQLWK